MNSKLLQVLRTYWTRPMCIVMGIGIVLLTGFLFYPIFAGKNYGSLIGPDLQRPAKSMFTDSTRFESSIARHSSEPIRSSTSIADISLPFPDFSRLQDLEAFFLIASKVDPKSVEELKSLPKLTSLSLHTTEIPDGTLTALASTLKELEIPSKLLLEHADELPQLSHLKLLRVDQSDLTGETITAIATIPNLENLVLPTGLFYSDSDRRFRKYAGPHGTLDLSEEMLRPLAEHPHLKGVFADWSPRLKRNHALLSAIHAYPNSYSRTQMQTIGIAVLFTASMALMLSFQLASQFLPPAAMVIPGYTQPHRIVAGLILAWAVLLAMGSMMFFGVAFLAAGALALIYPALIAVAVLSASSQHGSLRALSLPIRLFSSLPLMLAQVSWPFITPWMRGNWVWFLEGHFSAPAGLVLLAEFGVLVFVLNQIQPIARRMLEISPDLVNFSPWNRDWQQRRQGNASWQLRGLDAKLAHLAFHQGSMWKQIALLRYGNAYRPVFLAAATFLVVMFIGPATAAMRRSPGEFPSITSPTGRILISTVLGQMVLMALCMPVGVWYRRMKSMEMEFVRPVNRPDFARQLFLSLAFDQSVAVIPASLLALYWIYAPWPGQNANLVISLISLLVGFIVCAYAVSSTFLAFKLSWPLLIWLCGAAFACIAAVFIVMPIHHQFRREGEGLLLMTVPTSIVIIVLASIMTLWMYRRCRDREWG